MKIYIVSDMYTVESPLNSTKYLGEPKVFTDRKEAFQAVTTYLQNIITSFQLSDETGTFYLNGELISGPDEVVIKDTGYPLYEAVIKDTGYPLCIADLIFQTRESDEWEEVFQITEHEV